MAFAAPACYFSSAERCLSRKELVKRAETLPTQAWLKKEGKRGAAKRKTEGSSILKINRRVLYFHPTAPRHPERFLEWITVMGIFLAHSIHSFVPLLAKFSPDILQGSNYLLTPCGLGQYFWNVASWWWSTMLVTKSRQNSRKHLVTYTISCHNNQEHEQRTRLVERHSQRINLYFEIKTNNKHGTLSQIVGKRWFKQYRLHL